MPVLTENGVTSGDGWAATSSVETGELSLEAEASRRPKLPSRSAARPSLLTVTIAICTRNRPDNLSACLDAIARLRPSPDEVLVVDNSEGDAATKQVSCEHGARCIVEPATGLSRARNRALSESGCEIVAYMDDDALPSEDWLGQILAPFADPEMAMVSGEVEPEGATRDHNAPVRSLTASDNQWFEIATFGGLGMGTSMAVRKSVSSVWKGFDPRLGRGAPIRIAEESHAAASLVALGYRAAIAPAAIVHHPLKPIDRRHLAQEAAYSFAYWLLLLCEFPGHRLDLIRFLMRRLRGKPLTWPRDPQKPGELVTSGWSIRLKAGFAGILLYLRSRKLRAR